MTEELGANAIVECCGQFHLQDGCWKWLTFLNYLVTAGPHIGKFPLTSLPPGIPATGGVRLWLPPDLMFALRISAGTLSTVCKAITHHC